MGITKKKKKFSSLFPIFIIQKEQISHDSMYLSWQWNTWHALLLVNTLFLIMQFVLQLFSDCIWHKYSFSQCLLQCWNSICEGKKKSKAKKLFSQFNIISLFFWAHLLLLVLKAVQLNWSSKPGYWHYLQFCSRKFQYPYSASCRISLQTTHGGHQNLIRSDWIASSVNIYRNKIFWSEREKYSEEQTVVFTCKMK